MSYTPQIKKLQVLPVVILSCFVALVIASVLSTNALAYSPRTKAIFAHPVGGPNSAKSKVITNESIAIINAAPKGATVRLASLKLDIPAMKKPLVNAVKRGVSVRVVLPNAQKDAPLASSLATEINKAKYGSSYFKFCTRSCYSNSGNGTMHLKLLMASTSGDRKKVILTSSQNYGIKSMETSFNDAVVTVGQNSVYTAVAAYFDGLRKDSGADTHQKSVMNSAFIYSFYPNASFTEANDPYLYTLKKVVCDGASNGHGTKWGHTQISVSVPRWQYTRINVLHQLVRLKKQGCNIRVIMATGSISRPILKTLLNNKIPARYADKFDGDGKRIYYSHSKYMTVSGVVGKNTAVDRVYSGTANMSYGSLKYGDNLILQIRDNRPLYVAYQRNFDYAWSIGTKFTADDIPE